MSLILSFSSNVPRVINMSGTLAHEIRAEMRYRVAALLDLLAVRLAYATPMATGRLAASTQQHIIHHVDGMEAFITQGARGLGGDFYGPFIVTGIGPSGAMPTPSFRPPIAPFVQWVIAAKGVTDLKQAIREAYAVSRAVGRRGLKPNPYPLRVIQRSAADIQYISNAIGQTINVAVTSSSAMEHY